MLHISNHYNIYKASWQNFAESKQPSQMVNM